MVVEQKKLAPFIHLSSEVVSARWAQRTQSWDLVIKSGAIENAMSSDYLIAANGHYRYPKEPEWEGVTDWKASGNPGDRVVKHALWYRGSDDLKGRVCVVVGFGASGWDIARQALAFTNEGGREKPLPFCPYAYGRV